MAAIPPPEDYQRLSTQMDDTRFANGQFGAGLTRYTEIGA